jgi:hypothetical protein
VFVNKQRAKRIIEKIMKMETVRVKLKGEKDGREP